MDTLEEKRMNNLVELCGVLGGRPRHSHVSRDETYVLFPLEILRLSGTLDTINVMARRTLAWAWQDYQSAEPVNRGGD